MRQETQEKERAILSDASLPLLRRMRVITIRTEVRGTASADFPFQTYILSVLHSVVKCLCLSKQLTLTTADTDRLNQTSVRSALASPSISSV